MLKKLSGLLIIQLILLTILPLGIYAEEEPIIIGANFEQTGAGADYGYPALRALELAVEEQNAAGGLLGRQLKIITADNKSDKTETRINATKFIEEGAAIIIGPGITGDVEAQIPVIQDEKIPNILPMATGDGLTLDEKGEAIEYLFRVCFADSFQGTAAAKFVAEDLQAKQAIIITDTALDYSQGLADAFTEEFTKRGGEIVHETSYQAGDNDFMSILTDLQGREFDILYIPGYYTEVGTIIRQAREMGIDQPIVGGDGYANQTLVELAQAENATDIYYTSHFSALNEDEEIKSFQEAYEAKFNLPIDTFAALGYDAALLAFDAIERAGSTEAAAIQKALVETDNFQGITGTFSFDQDHNPIKTALMLRLENGAEKDLYEVEVD